VREAGSILDGKYEIVQSLGRGGMGEVYLVRHVHLEELRVIKILRQDLAADETAQKRFLREARLATQIKHPNVAILHDFARLPEGSFYMVWEHVEGQHVGQWLAERGPLPALASIELGIQALRGLEAIHASGVIHRDVSPDNLMITRDRRGRYLVKIIDLGLAKNLVSEPNFEVTEAGTFMGKLKYCSPEQAQAAEGAPVDLRSDLYSFGLVLYEMISGAPAFEAGSVHGSVMKRLSEPPLPLAGRNPEVEVPVALEAVIQRALARDPEDRYPSAVSFIEALEPIAYQLRTGESAPRSTRSRAHAPAESEMPAAPEASPASGDDTGQLSKAEKVELLARIDRAAKKQLETTQVLRRAEELIQEGELEQAQELIDKVGVVAPRAARLERVRSLLAERLEREERRLRLREMEQMVEGYIQKGQRPLAELALETLLDFDPDHPRQQEYREWIGILGQEVEQDRRAREILAAGRQALSEGDFKTARKRLAELVRHDRSDAMAPAFEREIETAEREARQSADQDQHRDLFEDHLAAGRLDAAEAELDRLAELGASRLALDLQRTRLEQARSAAAAHSRLEELEARYRERLEARDWLGARDLASELERLAPKSSRPAKMFAEISALEEQDRRTQALDQGLHQVESLIEAGQAEQAELALQILLRMDPELARRGELEAKIRALETTEPGDGS
jgi:serine/threonine-protein kinase